MKLHIIMKLYIIRLAIGFTALVVSFLPQKAEACIAECVLGWCSTDGHNAVCFCLHGAPVCFTP